MLVNSTGSIKHKPVLLKQLVLLMGPKKGDTVIDLTSGMGGHASCILESIGKEGRYVCVDQDSLSLNICKNYLNKKFRGYNIAYINKNFAEIDNEETPLSSADIVIADLGISSYQLDEKKRGFSFKHDGPLDMRMDLSKKIQASNIINEYEQIELRKIFLNYGELPYNIANIISSEIVEARRIKKIETTRELSQLIENLDFKQFKPNKVKTLVFQSIRIEVNSELKNLETLLLLLLTEMKLHAKIGVISFHSLEDRIVKKFFKYWSQRCVCDKKNPICVCHDINKKRLYLLNKKPIRPDLPEIKDNLRARSAHLRGAEIIAR
jgi:16S rRNA (cytosine1402-N4)-methyltransferase